jgi:[ribosomal protein S5]-alanine N-acetyltransferase
MPKTNHLQLRPVERFHKEAFLRQKSELAALLRVSVPERWPHFPNAFTVLSDESPNSVQTSTHWRGYFFIHPRYGLLVGNGGFKGPPDASGTVEIGYEIASEHWNRGFATEAVHRLIHLAFSHPQVNAVIAHTLAEKNASNRVLQKVGMKFVAEVGDIKVGRTWRWQIGRDAYSRA